MRYRLRTLLILLAVAAGCAPTPPVAQRQTPIVRKEPSAEPLTALEWADLDFQVQDRERFDVAQLPDRVRRLEGTRVQVRGYFHEATHSLECNQFLLVGEINARATTTKFGPLPIENLPLHQLAAVKMVDGRTASFTSRPVTVTGRLTFDVYRFDGRVVLVYRILADAVEPTAPRSGYHRALSSGC